MPKLLADAFFQQTTIQPVVDEVALTVAARVAGQTTSLTEWKDTGGVVRLSVDPDGDLIFANAKAAYFNMAAGNAGYIQGTGSNQLDVRGGSGGLRVLNNAATVTNLAVSDAGLVTLLDPLAVRIPTPTNYGTTVPSGSTGPYQVYNPYSRYIWHDLLAFNRWWGAPTFETFTGSWAADTLNNALWSQKEDQAITIIDGVTKTAARWTWNSSNIAFSYVDWWLLAFTYAGGTNSLKNILIETSVDGTVWTTRHTSTGNAANGAPAYFFAPINTADTWCRLTITVTNAITLPMSSIRALSSRWGNQGGGQEYSFPYSWDATQRMAIGAGAVVANAPLTIGTNTTASTSGIYFGTDTPLYRSGAAALTVAGSLAATAGIVASAYSTGTTQITFDTSVERALRLVNAGAWTDTALSAFLQIGPNTPDAGGAIIQGGTGAVLPRLQINATKIVAWDGAYTSAPIPAVATVFMAAAAAAGNIPLVARGFTSQTASLQEWQQTGGTVLAKVGADGRFMLGTVKNLADDGPSLNFATANVQLAHPGNQSVGHFSLSSNDSHILRLHSSLQAGGFNPAAAAGDNALIYSNGSAGTGALLVAPWHATSCGLRMDANAGVTITAGATGTVPLRVRGASGISVNLLDIMDGAGAVASAFSPFGSLKLRTTTQFGVGGSAALSVQTPSTGSEGIIVRATSGQTVSLQEWQDNAGAVLAAITAAGAFKFVAGAASGKVLTSDGSGVASWQTPPGSTDLSGNMLMLMGA